jgi:membrane protease YdiL (CAAX protease family)
MPDKTVDSIQLGFVIATLLLSSATCLCLFAVSKERPLLRFEPRRLVPWNAVGGALAFMIVCMTMLAVYQREGTDEPQVAAGEQSTKLVEVMTVELLITGGVLSFIAVFFKADRRDLGLPNTSHELASDTATGIIACLAAFAPVFIVQIVLQRFFKMPETESGHPLIKMLQQDGDPSVTILLLATITAVIVAPLCEEITFRLLLQGWLERWEAEAVGAVKDKPALDGEPTDGLPVDAPLTENSSFDIRHSSLTLSSPPECGVGGLRYGWLPIVISSAFFALAHVGYGPEPVPLFLLALIFGYMYYRTHRIVPCIVAHAMFNAFSMAQIWWMAYHPS